MKNRVSALFVALVMMLSLFSVGAVAWSTGEGIEVYWNGEKVGMVTYDKMDEHVQKFDDETYSNNKGESVGKVYYFNKLLKEVGKQDAWESAPAETTVELKDPVYEKPGSLTKAELDETRSYYKDGAAVATVKPGFMHVKDKTYFMFVYGQKTADESTSGNFVRFDGAGNATVKITTPEETPDEPTTKDGIEVFWNDKSVGSVSYDEMVDGISQATKTYSYSTINSAGTYDSFNTAIYPFTQLMEAVKKDKDWEAASNLTKVVFKDSGYETELTKATLTEERYFFDDDGVQADTTKPGFKITASNKGDYLQFVFGQKTKDEQTNGKFFKFKEPAQLYINVPDVEVIAPDGTSKGFSYNELDTFWQEEGSKKYTYTNSNTFPTYSSEELWGPTVKTVLAKAGIDLDALGDNDVVRFDASDNRGLDVTVKEIKRTRYAFPNGKPTNDYKGTTEAQYKDKYEVPYILSIKAGKTNIRSVFGQVDPQEQNLSYYIKYINKITVTKDGAKEYTGMTPTIADGSKVKKGDKLNFDLDLPAGVYEGAIHYTVSTDGTEPKDPTYADTMYNWAQNRTDDKDYLDPEKAKLYNIYEFTDAPKTIIKVVCYVSGYLEPTVKTLTYYGEEETKFTGLANEAAEDGNWYYYTDGVIDTKHTGVDKNDYGWWRVEDGKVNFDAQGIYQNENGWWKTTNGKVTFDETGVFKNDYGWWRVEDSKVNFKAQGIYKNDYGWWKTTDGKVTFDETGVFKNDYGWWRVEKSKVNFKANGIYKNQYGWWKTTKGKVTFKETGVFKNEYGWWRVEDSKVNFKANGLYKNEYGTWYVKNGKVDFSYNGTYQGKTIKDGKVQ